MIEDEGIDGEGDWEEFEMTGGAASGGNSKLAQNFLR